MEAKEKMNPIGVALLVSFVLSLFVIRLWECRVSGKSMTSAVIFLVVAILIILVAVMLEGWLI